LLPLCTAWLFLCAGYDVSNLERFDKLRNRLHLGYQEILNHFALGILLDTITEEQARKFFEIIEDYVERKTDRRLMA